MSGTLLRLTIALVIQQLTSKNARVYDWDVIRMRDEEEERSRVLASSGAAE